MPNTSNIESQIRKGVLEYCILSVIKDKRAYASDIIKELKKAKLIVVEGTLYPLLTRMKKAELLSYEWEESKEGPPRKYYYLTTEGLHFQNELKKYWDNLVSSVDIITNKKA